MYRLERWVSGIARQEDLRRKGNKRAAVGSVRISGWRLGGAATQVMPQNPRRERPGPSKIMKGVVARDALLVTDSAVEVEQPISDSARKRKFKQIRETLELQMPDWAALVRIVDMHRSKTRGNNWEQWADIEAQVLVDHPHNSLDV